MFHETIPMTLPPVANGPPESPWQIPCPACLNVQILWSKTKAALPAVWRARQSALVKVVVVNCWSWLGRGPPVMAVPPQLWRNKSVSCIAGNKSLPLPSHDGGDSSSDLSRTQTDWLNGSGKSDSRCSLNNWNVIGDGLSIVAGMVDNSWAGVRNSTGVQKNCADNNTNGGLTASNLKCGVEKFKLFSMFIF